MAVKQMSLRRADRQKEHNPLFCAPPGGWMSRTSGDPHYPQPAAAATRTSLAPSTVLTHKALPFPPFTHGIARNNNDGYRALGRCRRSAGAGGV